MRPETDWIPVASAPETSACVFTGAARVYAVGDLHGNYDGFRTILRNCGLIDGGDHWIGGDSHLVQLGDVFGRGGEPGKILNLIKKLEIDASSQGGRVHMLLGNHEILALRGCVYYNTREEFADFARPGTLEVFGNPGPETDDLIDVKLRERLRELGCWDFCRSLLPISPVGRWLLHRPTVLIVNDTLFVHGGLDEECGLADPGEINSRVRAEIFPKPDWTPVRSLLGADGPQWNRDYMLRPAPARGKSLKRVLAHHACRRMVVGHTPTSSLGAAALGKVVSLYEDRLLCVDTGIGRFHGERLSSLRIEAGAVEPVYPA